MVIESYGAWGIEAPPLYSTVASWLAITISEPKPAVLHIYGQVNLLLVRANATAILSRTHP